MVMFACIGLGFQRCYVFLHWLRVLEMVMFACIGLIYLPHTELMLSENSPPAESILSDSPCQHGVNAK
jgi:hypothetical protein